MYLQIPSQQIAQRNIHSIVSPRSHHSRTLSYYHQSHQNQFSNYLIDTKHDKTRLPILPQIKTTFQQIQTKIDSLTRPFHLLKNTKSYHLAHSRSYSTDPNNNPYNKFYSFKSIRQEKCKLKNLQSKVIKSIKFDFSHAYQVEKPVQRKKVIQHLDQVTTIQSKNSPRESLNSLCEPKIQQSQIIMRGGDLYQDLLKENNISNSILFPRENNNRMANFAYETPQNRKQLGQSTFYNITLNKSPLTGNAFGQKCMTQPRKNSNLFYNNQNNRHIHAFDHKTIPKVESFINSNKSIPSSKYSFLHDQENHNPEIHYKHQNNHTVGNSLSFLKVKKH